MTPRAVVFDLFGTLVPPWPAAAGLAYQQEMARRVAADPERFSLAWHADSHDRMIGPIEESLRRVCIALGVSAPADDELASIVEGRIALTRAALQAPRPEALPALAELRSRRIVVGVVSDCSSEVPTAWSSSPLAALVDSALFSASEGVRKPDPAIFARACERLGVSASECVFVGDGGSDELRGASAAGMRAVQLRSPDVAPVDWEGEAIESLVAVPRLLGLSPIRL